MREAATALVLQRLRDIDAVAIHLDEASGRVAVDVSDIVSPAPFGHHLARGFPCGGNKGEPGRNLRPIARVLRRAMTRRPPSPVSQVAFFRDIAGHWRCRASAASVARLLHVSCLECPVRGDGMHPQHYLVARVQILEIVVGVVDLVERIEAGDQEGLAFVLRQLAPQLGVESKDAR